MNIPDVSVKIKQLLTMIETEKSEIISNLCDDDDYDYHYKDDIKENGNEVEIISSLQRSLDELNKYANDLLNQSNKILPIFLSSEEQRIIHVKATELGLFSRQIGEFINDKSKILLFKNKEKENDCLNEFKNKENDCLNKKMIALTTILEELTLNENDCMCLSNPN